MLNPRVYVFFREAQYGNFLTLSVSEADLKRNIFLAWSIARKVEVIVELQKLKIGKGYVSIKVVSEGGRVPHHGTFLARPRPIRRRHNTHDDRKKMKRHHHAKDNSYPSRHPNHGTRRFANHCFPSFANSTSISLGF